MRVALTTADFLERGAQLYAEAPGVVDEPGPDERSLGTLTYGELGDRARALAAGLDALGINAGDRVAVASPNSARLLELFYAVTATGRVLVPVNFRLAAEEVGYIVEHAGARLLLVDADLDVPLRGVTCEHRLVLGAQSDAALLRPGIAPRPWPTPDEDALASINYTSGTTARPKGVELTHRNVWINATTLALHLGLSDDDVYLHTLPMFHANGWGLPFACAAVGVPQIVLRKVDGAEVLRRVAEHHVTLLCGAPAVLHSVLDAARDWRGDPPGRGRTRVLCGGAPPPSRTIARLEDELGWEFMQIYGLTETAPMLVLNRARPADRRLPAPERHRRLLRAGPPALGVRLRTDEHGEVLARGNQVLRGYWRDPEATAAALGDGWLHTGDGGRLDAEGYLTLGDRKKDVIISGGENVSSAEVEDRLHAHPDVADVAVIGVPDPRWGETVTAIVVLSGPADVTGPDLIAFARHGLAHYKCPTSIEFVDALPRTATGKVQKFRLRRRYSAPRQLTAKQVR
jgi:acyl-CoA synthetase (AMP-forming)/AMP-acid ligase II